MNTALLGILASRTAGLVIDCLSPPRRASLGLGRFALASGVGAPHGITYTVLSSFEIRKPHPSCPGHYGAIFDHETRSYTLYDHGTVIRTWTEVVDTFKRCYKP